MNTQQLRQNITIMKHVPTGRRYIVDQVQPAGITLSGLLGGARRLVSEQAISNAELWRIEYP